MTVPAPETGCFPLELRAVEPVCRPDAEVAFRHGDTEQFVSCAASRSAGLALVLDNVCALKARGVYEAALVHGFIGAKINHRNLSPSLLEELFRRCDREKLLAAGDALPGDGPFTVFRGVSGTGRNRRVRGLSWTGDLSVACWFALRFCDANPAVYTATVRADDVFCYTNRRDEREFICRPRNSARFLIGAEEMMRHASVVTERRRRAEQQRLQRFGESDEGQTRTHLREE